MNTKKIVSRSLLVCLILGVAYGLFKLASLFSPGTDPYSESYVINTSQQRLLEVIEAFKKERPEYSVPEEAGLKDEESYNKNDVYNVYFYNPKENKIIYTCLRTWAGRTEWSLVAINYGLKIGNWKEINKDLDDNENKKIKGEFKDQILMPIKTKLSNY